MFWKCYAIYSVRIFCVSAFFPDFNSLGIEDSFLYPADTPSSIPQFECGVEQAYVVIKQIPAFSEPNLTSEVQVVLIPGTLLHLIDERLETTEYEGRWVSYTEDDWWMVIDGDIDGYDGEYTELWLNTNIGMGPYIEKMSCFPTP